MSQGDSIEAAVNHFRRLPWCAKLIDAPGTRAVMPMCRRTRSASSGRGRIESQDLLFRAALNNNDNVPCMLVLFQDPDVPAAAGCPPGAPGSVRMSIPSISLLMDLQAGVKGFNGFGHGGFLATAMDEAMGSLIFSNYEYQCDQQDAVRAHGGTTPWTPPSGVFDMAMGTRVLTASMNVRFRRPVQVPSTIVTTATLNRIDGRKLYFDVVVSDEKDTTYASCEGMWMIIPPHSNL